MQRTMLCPECGGTITENSMECMRKTCKNCGLIIDEIEFETRLPFSRSFSNDKIINQDHWGNFFYPQISEIGILTDVNIRSSQLQNNLSFMRMNRYNKYPYRTNQLLKAKSIFCRINHNLHFPQYIQVEFLRYYNKCLKEHFIRGKKNEDLILAIIYLVNIMNLQGYVLHEILLASGKSAFSLRESIHNVFKVISQLKMFYNQFNTFKIRISEPTLHYGKYFNRIAIEYQISPISIASGINVLNLLFTNTQGNNPLGLIGALLYNIIIKEQLSISQSDICHKLHINETTLRKWCKTIKNNISA